MHYDLGKTQHIYHYTKISFLYLFSYTGHCTQRYSVCCVLDIVLSNDMVSNRLDYFAPHTSSNS